MNMVPVSTDEDALIASRKDQFEISLTVSTNSWSLFSIFSSTDRLTSKDCIILGRI